jgi:hypothetical protein
MIARDLLAKRLGLHRHPDGLNDRFPEVLMMIAA